MNIHVWWDAPADGPFNMAADELLAAEAVARGACCVRFYGWTPTSLSLGGFQRSAAARAETAFAGVPIVRRPSGGGAIVHGSDLTYAAAVPRPHLWGGRPQAFYDAFHEALRQALTATGLAAALWGPAAAAPPGVQGEEAFLCFDRRSSGDVVVPDARSPHGRGHKVMGSAQRRLQAAVLQHGSLLLHRNPDVPATVSHPGLDDLAPGGFPASEARSLAERWLAMVAAGADVEIVWESCRFAEERDIRVRARAFSEPRWTDRR